MEQFIEPNEDEEVKIVDKILSDAVNNSDAKTQYALGYCYLNGINVKRDYNKAVECFRKAVDNGNTSAEYLLGLCYLNGESGYYNEEEGMKLLQKVADQGDTWALYDMGQYYIGDDTRDITDYLLSDLQLNSEHGIGQCLEDYAIKLDCRFF